MVSVPRVGMLNPTLVSYTDAKKHNLPLADAPTSLQAGVFSAVHDRLRKVCARPFQCHSYDRLASVVQRQRVLALRRG